MGSTYDYTWPTINQAFAAGKIGMFINGSDIYTFLVQAANLDPKIYGIAPIPVAKNKTAGVLGGGALCGRVRERGVVAAPGQPSGAGAERDAPEQDGAGAHGFASTARRSVRLRRVMLPAVLSLGSWSDQPAGTLKALRNGDGSPSRLTSIEAPAPSTTMDCGLQGTCAGHPASRAASAGAASGVVGAWSF